MAEDATLTNACGAPSGTPSRRGRRRGVDAVRALRPREKARAITKGTKGISGRKA